MSHKPPLPDKSLHPTAYSVRELLSHIANAPTQNNPRLRGRYLGGGEGKVRRWGSLTVSHVESDEQKERRECGAPALSLVLRFWLKRYPVVRILNVPVLLQPIVSVIPLLP